MAIVERIFMPNNARGPWHPYFTWRPVRDRHGHWHWLRRVYRREIFNTYVNMDDWTRYEYGTVFDVLRDA